MHKLYILLLAAFFSSTTVSIASNKLPDSIGVENNKGKKVIIHKIEPKETYYSLAKRYNVTYKEVMDFNNSQLLQIGVIVKIPTQLPFETVSANAPANVDGFIEYTIKAKDNLNMLANRYGTTVDEIKRVNQLSSINLQIGQILKIPTAQAGTNTTPIVQPNTSVPVQAPVTESPNPPAVYTKPNNTNPANELNTTSPATNVISHTIKAKETLNALAARYGTTVDAIKKLNNLSSAGLRIGQVLKIASTTGEADQNSTEPVVASTNNAVPTAEASAQVRADGSFEHTVAVGETIYSIAKKYSLTTYQLTNSNSLANNELTVGQKLIIKGSTPRTATSAQESEDTDEVGETMRDPNLRQPASKFGLVRFDEKGTAIWIEDQDLDPSKMLVLHRKAPVGTIIRITNPMTNRSAFAKVVGKFTENESTKDVIIVMTKAVADAVGALDKRFYCNLNYGAVENEQK
ncbi:MAG: LysM peptidoglycan-binding domain-containing protein [Pedobacter sp.]|nr:MAG: LysM peptidoglycan-binding domain-containing protein [Pedobacter sp.]